MASISADGKPICLILVNYNSDADVVRLLKAVPTNELNIIVVENSASAVAYPSGTFRVPFVENYGYFGGARAALRAFPEILKRSEFVIVSNPDIDIPADFFSKLSQVRPADDLGLIGPQIYADGRVSRNPYMRVRPTSRRMNFYRMVFSLNWLAQIYNVIGFLKVLLKGYFGGSQIRDLAQEEDVYAVHGAMMVFTKVYFLRGGEFQHPTFLYQEEISTAEFCRSRNLKVRFDPNLEISHRERGATGVLYSNKTLGYLKDSIRAICQNYFQDRLP